MNETDKLIEEQFKTLPLNLQQAINAVPWRNLVQEIGKENNLNNEQMALLEEGTMLIIYGFEDPTGYSDNLVKAIGIGEITAGKIFNSVWDRIMAPISKKANEMENKIPEIPPINLPMLEKGEAAHDITPMAPAVRSKEYEVVKEKSKIPLPDYRYEGGKDPYREPIN